MTVLFLTLGCSLRNCGEAEIHTGYEDYDWDDGYDRCGSVLGMTGDEDVLGAFWLNAAPMHDDYAATASLFMSVYIEPGTLAVGETAVFIPEISGTWARSDAYLMDSDTAHVAIADLNVEASSIEVQELVEEQACSEAFASRVWVLQWDLLWGERGVEPWYASTGEDEVYLFRSDC